MIEEVSTLVTILSTASSTGLIVFVVWYFDMRKEQARAEQHSAELALAKAQYEAEIKLRREQHAEAIELLKAQHREIVTELQKEWTESRHDVDEKMTEMRQMYLNNVSLVKRYDKTAGDMKDAYILNTQTFQKAFDAIMGNQFCPIVRGESGTDQKVCA